jgi:hypothetical protein
MTTVKSLKHRHQLAFIITDKKLRHRNGRKLNPTNILRIIDIPIQSDTVQLLLLEKHIESYINYKQVSALQNFFSSSLAAGQSKLLFLSLPILSSQD